MNLDEISSMRVLRIQLSKSYYLLPTANKADSSALLILLESSILKSFVDWLKTFEIIIGLEKQIDADP